MWDADLCFCVRGLLWWVGVEVRQIACSRAQSRGEGGRGSGGDGGSAVRPCCQAQDVRRCAFHVFRTGQSIHWSTLCTYSFLFPCMCSFHLPSLSSSIPLIHPPPLTTPPSPPGSNPSPRPPLPPPYPSRSSGPSSPSDSSPRTACPPPPSSCAPRWCRTPAPLRQCRRPRS